MEIHVCVSHRFHPRFISHLFDFTMSFMCRHGTENEIKSTQINLGIKFILTCEFFFFFLEIISRG